MHQESHRSAAVSRASDLKVTHYRILVEKEAKLDRAEALLSTVNLNLSRILDINPESPMPTAEAKTFAAESSREIAEYFREKEKQG